MNDVLLLKGRFEHAPNPTKRLKNAINKAANSMK